MMSCKACGADTPRLRLSQRYCSPCEARIADTIRRDTERRIPRFTDGKVLSGGAPR